MAPGHNSKPGITTASAPVLSALLASALLASSPLVGSDDPSRGMELHQKNCQQCHQTDIYQRSDREINSLAGLRSRVLACSVENNIDWFDDEVDHVTAYLNKSFYLFGNK